MKKLLGIVVLSLLWFGNSYADMQGKIVFANKDMIHILLLTTTSFKNDIVTGPATKYCLERNAAAFAYQNMYGPGYENEQYGSWKIYCLKNYVQTRSGNKIIWTNWDQLAPDGSGRKISEIVSEKSEQKIDEEYKP